MELSGTRRALHGIAELVLAGPQHRAAGTIRLRVTPGGFGQVAGPIRVEGTDLVWADGRAPLAGTYRELAARAGVEPEVPEGVYPDHSGVSPDDEIVVDREATDLLLGWFGTGEQALRAFAAGPGAAIEPVLWPEHFDLAIAKEEVTYGVSPGDAGHEQPYAYVGPWKPREGAFWNASFGAVHELTDEQTLQAFFSEGASRTR
ncbi:hypothetical protein [Pseudonocardia pini]|uniref:hypothetical protein n=1 Tax=Pseudonocardia pini TaxID=2758030 RepID=UPI0015F0A884|nr:hypothetical protein [Pseudonocardia pini]